MGAVFGQTEGLLGEDLDLRELQRTGRIGRIEIVIKSEGGHSKGEIVIPVSLNKTATAILAASLETVDRVGPCIAKVTLEKIEDIRGAKRRRVVSRAISILKGWEEDIAPETEEITEEVSRASRKNISKYGPDRLPAGPDIDSSEEIIIVEGRADVINLLKSGITNAIAIDGTHIPKSIVDLTKNKTVTAFLDGDRGGDLILRELMQVAKIDYIARAPEGKEVEELTKKEITRALQSKIPSDQALALVTEKRERLPHQFGRTRQHTERTPRYKTEQSERLPAQVSFRSDVETLSHKDRLSEIDQEFISKIPDVQDSFHAIVFDQNKKIIAKCGVSELAKILEAQEHVYAVIFDGVVTQRLVDIAIKKGMKLLVGAAIADLENKPTSIRIFTFEELLQQRV